MAMKNIQLLLPEHQIPIQEKSRFNKLQNVDVEKVKLPGVNLEGRLNFDFHVTTILKQTSKKYHALARACNYMNKKKMTYFHECFHNISIFLLLSWLDIL